MKRATVRQIQHQFREILSWVADGEEIEVTSRGKVVARLVPAPEKRKRKVNLPDFAARLRDAFPEPLSTGPTMAEIISNGRD